MDKHEIKRPMFLCELMGGKRILCHFETDVYKEDTDGYVTCEYPVQIEEVLTPAQAPSTDGRIAMQHGMRLTPFSYLQPPRKMHFRLSGYCRNDAEQLVNVFQQHKSEVERARSGLQLVSGLNAPSAPRS